ncbi:MAG: hypothetical protein PHC70_01865 [Patescibacteria group bacterium]|nr:hypothetical protein [Patescibacteria group bacterium]
MQKKYLVGSLICLVGIVGVWQLAANAQTWSGPKTNCYDPSQPGCNVDGVIWNRSNAAIDTATPQLGNYKISGRAEIGDDLKFLGNAKAIRIDQPGSSILNIGNWKEANSYINLNILGNLSLQRQGKVIDPKIAAPQYCFTDAVDNPVDCITSWPVGGGGGGTVTSVGSGNGLTGGPIVGAGSLSIIACGNGKVLKTAGGVWACGDDIDTNSGGTITTINAGSGLSVINPNGPATTLSPNYTVFDSRYVLKSGDTMSGGLSVQGVLDGQATSRFGFSGAYGDFLLNVQPAANTIFTKGTISHTGAINSSGNMTVTGAGYVKAPQFCIGVDCINSWPVAGTGDVTDVFAGSGITVTNGSGPQPSVKISSCGSNGQVMMWDALNSAWACAMPVENVQLSGVGLTGGGPPNASGIVSIGLDSTYTDNRYVKKAGDTMSGGLTLSTGNLSMTSAGGANSNIFLPVTSGIGFNGSRSNTGFLQLWSDGIFYWDLGTTDNLTIRNHNLTGTALQIKSGDLVVPTNKWGDGQTTLAGCTYVARNAAGGATQCAAGQFMSGVSMNGLGTSVGGIYCCPL